MWISGQAVFETIDFDNSGSIDVDEFLFGPPAALPGGRSNHFGSITLQSPYKIFDTISQCIAKCR